MNDQLRTHVLDLPSQFYELRRHLIEAGDGVGLELFWAGIEAVRHKLQRAAA